MVRGQCAREASSRHCMIRISSVPFSHSLSLCSNTDFPYVLEYCWFSIEHVIMLFFFSYINTDSAAIFLSRETLTQIRIQNAGNKPGVSVCLAQECICPAQECIKVSPLQMVEFYVCVSQRRLCLTFINHKELICSVFSGRLNSGLSH